jgi:UDP-N-acetyl-2-amino-2-deoxyglucuronate dehydrogenase
VGIIKFESGCLATIEVTTAARPRDFEASISIVGEKGIAQVGGIALNKIDVWDFVDSNESIEEVSKLCDVEVLNGMGFGHLDYLNDLISCLSSDGSKVPESTNALELVHALYSSVEKGEWINVADKNRSKFLGK